MIQSRRNDAVTIDCSALAGKNLLNILVLASNSVISSLFISRGGVLGTFFSFHKVLSVAHCNFMDLGG